MGKKVLALLIFLLLPMVFSPPLTKAETSMKIGVLAHEMTPSEAQLLASNGVGWIRSDVSINDSETNWHTIYRLSKQYNLQLIGTILPYTLNFNNSMTMSDWNFTVRKAVSQFGDIVKVWEIWNEPTFPQSGAYLGCYQGTAQQYVDLMKGAYHEIKSVYPNDIVLGLGGLPLYTSIEPTASNTYVEQALNWTQQVVDLGGMQYCDAISLHAYPYGTFSDIAKNAFISSLENFRNITHKEIWITESGQESVGNSKWQSSEQEQNSFLSQSYTLLQQQNVKAYIWYELNDSSERNSTFGLYNINLEPKSCLQTFLTLANSSASTITYTPSPILFFSMNFSNSMIVIVVSAIAVLLISMLLYRRHRKPRFLTTFW